MAGGGEESERGERNRREIIGSTRPSSEREREREVGILLAGHQRRTIPPPLPIKPLSSLSVQMPRIIVTRNISVELVLQIYIPR